MKLHQLRFSKAKIAPKLVSEDEHPRPSSTVEALTKLKPLFEGGVVTVVMPQVLMMVQQHF